MDTYRAYEQLAIPLGREAAGTIAGILGEMYSELQNTVTKSDFSALHDSVTEIAEAQKRTEIKVERLATGLEQTNGELMKVDQRLTKLETEMKEGFQEVDQRLTKLETEMKEGFQEVDHRITKLETEMKEGFQEVDHRITKLETEMKEGFQEVDQRFTKLEAEMKEGFQEVDQRLTQQNREIKDEFESMRLRQGVIGSRWGDGAEEAFRAGLLESVRHLGYRVEHFVGQDPEGFINYSSRSYDLDILVYNGTTIAVEIKSSASGADITEFHRSVLLFQQQTGRRVEKSILVAVTPQKFALQKAQDLGVILATDFSSLK